MSSLRFLDNLTRELMMPRLALCLLLIALTLLVLPKRGEQASTNSGDPPGTQGPERSQDEYIARSASSLAHRMAVSRLAGAEGTSGASVSMAPGDFDEDGVADLIVGVDGPEGPSLSFFRGNEDALYPNSPQAQRRRSLSKLSDPPALLPARSFPLFDTPDFLAAGDFNGDGHLDVATASRAGNALYLLLGDGHGNFPSRQRIELSGRVTFLSASETLAAAGLSYLAVGVVDNLGAAAILFKSLDGPRDRPAIIRLPAEPATLAFRQSHSTNSVELLIASGSELLVAPLDTKDAEAGRPITGKRAFSSIIRSIAVGDFAGLRSSDVAVLTADGTVRLLTELESGDFSDESVVLGSWPPSTQLIRARVSGSDVDDLVLLDPSDKRLHVLVGDRADQGRVSASVNTEGEPIAVLPMRLNEDALSGLVILNAGPVALESVRAAAAMTFVVNNTADGGAGSLRQAILDANVNPGADTINFNIPGPAPHTIIPMSPLPAITEALTINGASQPDFAGSPVVELNGISAGVADGLTINTSGCDVRSLVINRFSGNGIAVNGNGNIIEGNFIGTNATGAFALGNTQDGVFISGGAANTIGGTTAAARNVISGNRNGIQISGGSGTQVRGNFIGTNAAGTGSVGNSLNGVLISGSGNAVGAVGSASSNTIAFNGGAGVAVAAGTGNPVLSNSIFSNGGLGIDLFPPGVTPNDPCDADSGPNNLQNFPVLNSASAAGTSTAVQGTLNSTPSSTFRLEFFSNQAPNPSGFGEGQTFIGAIVVNTDSSCNASFNPTFPVTVAPGLIITATATDLANNTSEFSKAIQVGGLAGGTAADLSVITSIAPNPVETGSQITKTLVVSNAGPATATSVTVTEVLSGSTTFISCNSTGGGVCGGTGNNRTITFASLAPGSTAVITIIAQVNCSVANGTVIGNTATVFSSSTPDPNPANNVSTATTIASHAAPRITCPANITRPNDPGQCGAAVSYSTPVVVGTCPLVSLVCSPPSGSNFAIGTTTVTCVATDTGGLAATCSFTVTVIDVERITVSCPPNVTVTASPSQCSPVVSFPAPTIRDKCPGASVSCVPPSGSSFPLGVTNVVCTAIDAKGVQATCSFTVTVIGTPQAVVRLEGDGSALDFGPVPAARKAKLRKQKSRNFTIENIGCLPLVLTFDSVSRVGTDVDRGRIGDPDDRAVFTVYTVDPTGAEAALDILTDVRIAASQKQNFKVRFHPLIPVVAKATRGLQAADVIPDLITSQVTFSQNAGAPIRISLVGHVATEVLLTDPDNPRNGPQIVFSRLEDEFIIEYTIYDSNLDLNKASYQFFDKQARPAENPITVDLAQLVQQGDFVRGQSFTIVQRISGARDHPEIVGVRVTVSDSESSDFADSQPNSP